MMKSIQGLIKTSLQSKLHLDYQFLNFSVPLMWFKKIDLKMFRYLAHVFSYLTS